MSVDLLVDPYGSAYPFELPVDPSWSPEPTADEIAVLAELARLFPPDPDRPVHREDLLPWDRDDLPDLEDLPDREDQPARGAAPAAAAEIVAVAERAGGCGAADLALLEATDPASLDDPLARIAYVKVLNRVEAAIAARRYDAVLSFVPVMAHESDYLAEGAREIDLAVACRSSLRAARQMIDAARATRLVFPGMFEALAAGRVSDRHVRILLERTRVIDDAATLVLIGEQALPLAEQLTPPRFEDALEQVIIAFDPDAPARRKRAHADRDVWTCRLPDGMAFLGITTDAATVAAMHDRIRAAAKDLHAARGGAAAVRAGNPDASMHACAADAAAAIILGTTTPDGTIVFDPAAQTVVHVQLVIDLETLRGERDNPALLHGCPIPATMARDIAGYARAFRRIVTDPVTGVALDYGREQYLPAPLRDYVLHRDGGCRIPGCGCRTISQLQMDHALKFPLGPSTPANTGGISPRCHQIKTAGFFDLVDGHPDGSVTLVTMLGQRIRIPPRPFMGWHPPPPHDTQPDTPPF
jgi:hypothetical protein